MGLIRKKKKAAVILAAGSSSRMNGTDKLEAQLCGESVICRSIRAFEINAGISEIVLVVRKDRLSEAAALAAEFSKVKKIVGGGETRMQSAYNGVMAVSPGCGIILIHDAARPLVSQEIINRTAAAAEKYSAALPAAPVKSTIKTVRDGFVTGTADRSELYEAQTPQAFSAELIKAALTDAVKNGLELTDDCAAAERLGMRAFITEGEYENIKITTPEDLTIAEALSKRKAERA